MAILAIINSGRHFFGPATPLLYATCSFNPALCIKCKPWGLVLKKYRQVGRWFASLCSMKMGWAVYGSEVPWPSLHPAAPGCRQPSRQRWQAAGLPPSLGLDREQNIFTQNIFNTKISQFTVHAYRNPGN